MAECGSLDKWRDYFRSANADIFSIIEHAIMVAASDCPHDFKSKRGRIAEVLFAKLEFGGGGGGGGEGLGKIEGGGSKDTKESKVNSGEGFVNGVSDDEALNDEIKEEFHGEVFRIKAVLDNHINEESDAVLLDSLRRLQLMPFSVETLKATGIGKSVSALRKRGSKEIRNLVLTLIQDWKIMVDLWVDATKAIEAAETGTESAKTSVVEDEEGLPNGPPGGERESGALKPSNYESGPGRPKPTVRPNVQQNFDKGTVQKNPMASQQQKFSRNNESSIRMNFEIAKRKMHQRYQEVENAKKQRTIKVVELSDLPKQSFGHRNQQTRPVNGNHNRNRANGQTGVDSIFLCVMCNNSGIFLMHIDPDELKDIVEDRTVGV